MYLHPIVFLCEVSLSPFLEVSQLGARLDAIRSYKDYIYALVVPVKLFKCVSPRTTLTRQLDKIQFA